MAASSHEQSLSMINYSNWICFQMVLLVILSRLAASFSTVKYLPGFSGSLPFKLETGYIGVDENEDAQLFYYFVESEGNPREDPLLLWLTGGPGCSALSGLVFEIGPLHFNIVEYNGSLPTLKLHPHSWTKVASIIFLDAPVGTGFSYSRCLQGSKSSDIKYANHSYEFLRKWLLSHPKFIGNPFYVAGDSYSGMIVPVIAHEISAGNPFTDAKFDVNSRVPFAHRVALISDELYKSAKRNCKGEYIEVDSRNVQCAKDLKAISECTDKVNGAHILEPLCRSSGVNVNKMDAGYHRSMLEKYNDTLLSMANSPKFGCRNYNNFLCNIWGNDIDAHKALHVRKGTFTEWVRCNKSILDEYYVNSTLSYHLRLNKRGYRALIYSGDHDKIIPYLGTLSWIKALNFTVIDDWQPWLVDDQVAGEGVIQLQSTSRRNALLCSKDDYIRSSNSSGDDDEDDNVHGSECEPQKLTRAQRKRLRKKKLKEDASRRSKIIGPLLPTPNNDDDGGGENVSPSVRQNADEECAVTSDMPREIIGCSDQKKLKNRRKAKKLTRDRLKCSSSKENCSEDQKLKSPNETCDQAHHSCSQD
ncbi:hypothetical protein Q3G72_034029 [Acer saccharum]|nr:hypothetical protein Q3G72_034029 [Acer saccharum]